MEQLLSVRFGHFTGSSLRSMDITRHGDVVEEWEEKYRVVDITLRRPRRDIAETAVRCPVCHRDVAIIIESAANVRKKRLECLLVVVLLAVYIVIVALNVRPGPITVFQSLAITIALFAIGGIVFNLRRAFQSTITLALTVLEGGKEHRFFARAR